MDTQKQQIVDRLKQANNILVTVKSNPSVDHLAACIALTLALNKLGKHATAVFSGAIPSTIEFLQPEKTLEKNTDSLRDFIIALDKSKADKLRYKVEDKVVKIFITPYKTSISDKDLEFSQGDFNVDVVLALGVHQQNDLDQAITAHGRILHDATVASVNVEAGPNIGSLNWTKPNASSLAELAVELMDGLDKSLLDGQIATAALTGIVAETDRFSNNKTSPQTMSISAELMAVGANQQLVATKLSEPPKPAPVPVVAETAEETPAVKRPDDGTLEIEHDGDKPPEPPQINIDENGSLHRNDVQPPVAEPPELPQPVESPAPVAEASDEAAEDGLPAEPELPKIMPGHTEGPHMVLQPPSLGGQLSSAGGSSEFFDPLVDAASGAPPTPPILDREPLGASPEDASVQPPSAAEPTSEPVLPKSAATDTQAAAPSVASVPAPEEPTAPQPTLVQPPVTLPEPTLQPPAVAMPSPVAPETDGFAASPTLPAPAGETLSDIEKELHSPHVTEDGLPPADNPGPPPDLSSARDAVAEAVGNSASPPPLAPIQALNAQPLGQSNLHESPESPAAAPAPVLDVPGAPTPGASGPTVSPAIIPNNPAPFAPEGLTLPGVTGATESPATTSRSLNAGDQKQDPNAPPSVPPPLLPPIPS